MKIIHIVSIFKFTCNGQSWLVEFSGKHSKLNARVTKYTNIGKELKSWGFVLKSRHGTKTTAESLVRQCAEE